MIRIIIWRSRRSTSILDFEDDEMSIELDRVANYTAPDADSVSNMLFLMRQHFMDGLIMMSL
jgi:hypothetical protein